MSSGQWRDDYAHKINKKDELHQGSNSSAEKINQDLGKKIDIGRALEPPVVYKDYIFVLQIYGRRLS